MLEHLQLILLLGHLCLLDPSTGYNMGLWVFLRFFSVMRADQLKTSRSLNLTFELLKIGLFKSFNDIRYTGIMMHDMVFYVSFGSKYWQQHRRVC